MAKKFRHRLMALGTDGRTANEIGDASEMPLNAQLTLGSSGQIYTVTPIDGSIIDVYAVINGSLSTSDETLTVKDKDGNSVGTITLSQSGSAAGDVFSLTSSLSNTSLSAGDPIEVETDGSNGSSVACELTIRVRRD